jgi:hypothetical protein
MLYSGVVTVVLEHATLTQVDEETRGKLEAAADAYEQASPRLRAAIITAARAGNKPSEITRAIRHAYTYEYVSRLIREDKAGNPEAYPAGS